MSDSVTQIEIEDVLSSIRRLVSEDARPRPARKPGGAQDRLVLTPSQRVESDGDVSAAFRDAAADTPDAEDAGEPIAVAASVREEVARVVRTGDTPPVVDAPATQGSPLDAVARLVEKAVEDEVTAVFAEEAAPQEDETVEVLTKEVVEEVEPLDDAVAEAVAAATAAPQPELSPLERKIAELEALVAQGADDFEPDVQEPGDNAPEEMSASDAPDWEPEELDADPLENDSLTELLNRTMSDEPSVEDELEIQLIEVPEAEPEDAKIVDLSLVASAVTPVAPSEADDAPEEDAVDDPVAEVAEAPEPEVSADPGDAQQGAEESEPARFVRSPHLTVVQDDVETLDAEMLRSIVVQIVREELQSTLGERITRNVRKLVRREIQRAMMHHSID